MSKILESKDLFVDQLSNPKIVSFFDNKGIAKQFADFMEKFQIDNERYYKTNYENLECPKLRCSIGRNYIKINDGRSVVAFIDKYGNIYKPASWQAPATGVRYYVSDWRSIKTDPHGGWLYGNNNLVPKGHEEPVEESLEMRKVIEAVVDEAALQYEKKYRVGKGEFKGAIVLVQKSKSSKSVQIIAKDDRLDIWEVFDNEKEALEWLDNNKCTEITNESVSEGKMTKEEIDALCDELHDYLLKKIPKYLANSLYIENGIIKADIDGDWKHDHLAFKNAVQDFFKSKKIKISMAEIAKPSDDDNYEATHSIAIKESKVIEAVIDEEAVVVKGDLLSKLSWDLKSAFPDDQFIGVVETETGASKELTKITFSCAEDNDKFKDMLHLQDFTFVNKAGINKPSEGEEFWTSKDMYKIATLFKNFKKNKILKDSVRNATIK